MSSAAQTLIHEWKPNPKQELFLSLPDSIFEALFGGAAGGGKSEVLLLLPLIRGFHEHPRFKGIIFRRTFPELKREIIERSHLWYPHFGAKYNSTDHQWQFPSRAIMRFGHMEYEVDAKKYDTDEYNYVAWDEVTSFTYYMYQYVTFTRIRSSVDNLPAIARAGTNPGNIGHAWVRDRFVEPVPKQKTEPGTIIIDKRSGKKRIFIQSFVTDNPYLKQDYINSLQLLSTAERKAKLEGDWYTFEGQVFSEWRENRLDDEPENALHVIEPFDIPDWWIRVLAIDWGFAASTYALWGAISPLGRVYIYREYEIKQAHISTWATEIAARCQGETLRSVVMCRSAWQNRGEDEGLLHEQFRKYSGLTPIPADNARIAGKLLLQEYLRWHPKPSRKIIATNDYNHEYAMRLLRVGGSAAYNEYLKEFEPEAPEDNLPKLQSFSSCPIFNKTIPLCVYGDNDSDGKPSEDVKEFVGDDPYDTGRYLIREVDNIRINTTEIVHIGQVARIVKGLEDNKDMTSFYRKMEHLEKSGNNGVVFPVKRMHRRAGMGRGR